MRGRPPYHYRIFYVDDIPDNDDRRYENIPPETWCSGSVDEDGYIYPIWVPLYFDNHNLPAFIRSFRYKKKDIYFIHTLDDLYNALVLINLHCLWEEWDATCSFDWRTFIASYFSNGVESVFPIIKISAKWLLEDSSVIEKFGKRQYSCGQSELWNFYKTEEEKFPDVNDLLPKILDIVKCKEYHSPEGLLPNYDLWNDYDGVGSKTMSVVKKNFAGEFYVSGQSMGEISLDEVWDERYPESFWRRFLEGKVLGSQTLPEKKYR